MKKRKLKKFVLPAGYLLITMSIFVGIILFSSNADFANTDYDYGVSTLKTVTKTVLIEDEVTSSIISSPVDDGKAEVAVHYYNMEDDESVQKESLIYYENTYLPNTGTIYTADEEFQVKAIFGGKVVEVSKDEFFGQYVVVKHSDSLSSYYYGLDNIEVEVDEEISTGTVLGTSQNNEILNSKKSFLLEVYHNNELINPEDCFETKITDYE